MITRLASRPRAAVCIVLAVAGLALARTRPHTGADADLAHMFDPGEVAAIRANVKALITDGATNFDALTAIASDVDLTYGVPYAMRVWLTPGVGDPRCARALVRDALYGAWGDPGVREHWQLSDEITATLRPDCTVELVRQRRPERWVASLPFDKVGRPLSALRVTQGDVQLTTSAGVVLRGPLLVGLSPTGLCVSLAAGRITAIAAWAVTEDVDARRIAASAIARWGIVVRDDAELSIGSWSDGTPCHSPLDD